MFNIFKRKKKVINTDEIKNFNNVLKVIGDFIYFEDYTKAERAINEVLAKENESFKNYIENVEEKNKKQELKKFKEKLDKIHALKDKLDNKKAKYEISIKERKKKEELKFTKKQVEDLIGKHSFDEAISFLNILLEKHKNDIEIINYINKEKKHINKKIEKYKIKKENEIRNDAYKQAQELIWDIKRENEKAEEKINTKVSFIESLKAKMHYFSKLRQKRKETQLLDEINILIETQADKNELLIKNKLTQIHSGITREIYWEKINGYDLYGKIIWADKISWDNLWFHQTKTNSTFYIWDATGHGIRAWFIISQMTKKFHELSGKVWLEWLVMEINNSLKQELKSGNFITSIFFDINKENPEQLDFIWMWHEPIFVYRAKTSTVEKIIPGWLAAWIRIIKDMSTIKKKTIHLEDGDILISYTDGIVEARNSENQLYSIDRIWQKLGEIGKNQKLSLEEIYNFFLNDLRKFAWWKVNYGDDVTLLLLKRDANKEVLVKEEVIEKIITKEWLDKKFGKKLKWKTMEEIRDEIKKIQQDNAIKNILRSLEILYKTWELLKLKQDCIRYIRDGYIDKKINFYLKKALDNENKFKITQKNKKIQDKYNILKELYKKWDYETVIIECSNIISKDGNL